MSTKPAAAATAPAIEPAPVEDWKGDWTDEELEAMAQEAFDEADRDNSWVDGPSFMAGLIERTRQRAEAIK